MRSIERGDVPSALDDLERVLLMSNHMDGAEIVIGHLVAFALRSIYASAVERMVIMPQADEAFLQGVLAQLGDWPTTIDWAPTIRIHAYEIVWSLRNVNWSDEDLSWDWKDGFPKDDDDWALVALGLPKTRIDGTRLSLERWIEVLETYDSHAKNPMSWARGIDARLPTGTGFWHASEMLANAMQYPWEAALGSGIRDSAAREVLKSSLEVLLAMRNSSSDPFEEIGIDPWTGTNLLYKDTKDGFIIYSVGQDGSDDGGARDRLQDIVFEFPRKRQPAPSGYYSSVLRGPGPVPPAGISR